VRAHLHVTVGHGCVWCVLRVRDVFRVGLRASQGVYGHYGRRFRFFGRLRWTHIFVVRLSPLA
jgi:hypothetical protein